MAAGELPSNGAHSRDPVMPIAIVGIGGRYPGNASNPEKLWDLIAEKRSALTEVPQDRFNVDAFYHPHHERQGTINVRGGHFMEGDVSAFDAPFFSLTPNEAKAMDPQQRMALECTYEALENAGLRMEDVVGSNTSCYVGSFTKDYGDMLASGRGEDAPLYFGIGTGTAILSNRISWFFDFKGPSISVDTACSSSLVALHLACQSIRAGESEMSIVGGVNVILVPDVMSAMTSLHFLSPDSKCHSFDAAANGYARGEGTSVVILKPLALALRDHDVIRGVIRNTACNQDGNTPGITVPSADAQETLIRNCYGAAALDMGSTKFVECHGTGTPAGDPLEAAAVSATLGKARARGDHVLIGSIKSNIGHLEGASGLAQVTKAVLALEKGVIPPNIWYEKANPRIPMDDWNLQVPVEMTTWPAGVRRVSINSFGYGGTNAHCIVDDAYHYLRARHLHGNHNTMSAIPGGSPASLADSGVDIRTPDPMSLDQATFGSVPSVGASTGEIDYFFKHETPRQPKLFVWSSNEQSGVHRVAKLYRDYLDTKLEHLKIEAGNEEVLFRLFSHTLASRRSILPWKTFTVASSAHDLRQKLETSSFRPKRSSKAPRLGFIFTGQGAQWHAMGRELCAHQVFQQSLESASAYLVSIGASWSLLGELRQNERDSRINEAAISQPACTALQVALVDLLQSWGIRPVAVAGHSSGEIAAAYTEGSISREAAWAISYHRGRLTSSIRGLAPNMHGTMVAVGLGPQAVQPYLDLITEGNASIACINSPSSTTLSGDATAVAQVTAMLKNDGHFARPLKVDTAYHSHHMQVIASLYLESIRELLPTMSNRGIKMFSCVTGKVVESPALGAPYWVANMLNQVNFQGAVESLCQHSDSKTRRVKKPFTDILIEIGPHAALQGPIQQILKAQSAKMADIAYISVLKRGEDACQTSLDALGHLFQSGYKVDISAANSDQTSIGKERFLVDIPPFAWNRDNKYWCEPNASKSHRFRAHARNDLFGGETLDGLPLEPRWKNTIKLNEIPWIEHHRVQGTILYPAAGMMIMAIEAARQKADPTREIEGYELRDVLIGKAIVIPDDDSGTETMLSFRPWRLGSQASTAVWQEFTLSSRNGEGWIQNCSGLVLVKYKSTPNPLFVDEHAALIDEYRRKFRELETGCSKSVDAQDFYEHLASIGLQYSGPFKSLTAITEGDYKANCALKIPDTKILMPMQFAFDHVIHPSTLDGIIQIALPAAKLTNDELTVSQVPTSIARLYVSADLPSGPGSMIYGCSAAENVGFDDAQASILASTADWEKPLIIFEGMRTSTLKAAESGFAQAAAMRKLVTHFHWQEDIEKLNSTSIETICRNSLQNLSDIDSSVVADLELAAFIYMKRVINTCSPEEATTFKPHLKKFYALMQRTYHQVVEGNVAHQHQGINWLNTSAEFEERLLAQVANASADGAVLCQHGENLIPIMRGEIMPLEVLMKDDLLHNLYQYGVGYEQTYAQLAQYMDLVAHKNPEVKILEIGGGTGGATLPVLQRLGGENGTAPRFMNYTFTDISTGFFEKAHEKFKSWLPVMNFHALNIEEDPLKQGFEEGEYDIVIAANVLHATGSMDQTLANVKKLLKPTGKLVLAEITNPLLRVHMIVGSLDGWWLGGKDGREWGPTMTEDAWNNVLVRRGFSGVDVTFQDSRDPQDHLYSVMVSSASPTDSTAAPANVIFIQPQHPSKGLQSFTEMMTERLERHGAKVSVASLHAASSLDIAKISCIFTLDCGNTLPILPDISPEDWTSLQSLILKAANSMWISRGGLINSEIPSAGLMAGLSRSIRAENPLLALTTLDLDHNAPIDTSAVADATTEVFLSSLNAIHRDRPEWEYAIRNDKAMVQRILLEKGMNDLISSFVISPEPELAHFKQQNRPLKLEAGTPGRLDTFRFIDDDSSNEPLSNDEVEIEVKAVGLNFKDIMIAMGQLQERALGVECSGVVNRVGSRVSKFKQGDRVMTWRLGTFRTFARTPESMCIAIPNGMAFDQAASLPVVYTTAYYALAETARVQQGETVLIHSAAGGVGQAAIVLAQHFGAEVFATVSSETKKKLLMDEYNIPEDHLFNSRDESFVDGIMRMTNQRGVDVVLNSLAGEALRRSWYCMTWFGRFVEMGQKDIVGNTGLDMAPFIKNISFHSINLLGLLQHNLPKASEVFRKTMKLFCENIAKPIKPTITMPFSQVEEAFRLMQTGKHMGKIVLEPREGESVSVIPPGVEPVQFDRDSTYLLSGGLGGLGRSLANWMVQQGAGNVVFLSRSGTKKPEAKTVIAELTLKGAKVATYECDVSNSQQVQDVVRQCAQEFPPIRGVIQGAMVLKDAVYSNMTHDQYVGAIRPKVQGSWNLHENLPKNLDFFVLLSSSAGIAGSRGQANYAAGNTYQDALAHYRRNQGLAASCIDLGIVLEVGFVAENKEGRVQDNTKSWNFIGIRQKELHAMVQAAITGKIVASDHKEATNLKRKRSGESDDIEEVCRPAKRLPTQIITGLGTGGMANFYGNKIAWWFRDAKFSHLRQVDTQQATPGQGKETMQIQSLLSDAGSMDEAADIMCAALVQKLAKSLMVSVDDIEPSRPISRYGVDSLLAVEIRSWLFTEVQADISVFELLSSVPISALVKVILGKSKCVAAAVVKTDK